MQSIFLLYIFFNGIWHKSTPFILLNYLICTIYYVAMK